MLSEGKEMEHIRPPPELDLSTTAGNLPERWRKWELYNFERNYEIVHRYNMNDDMKKISIVIQYSVHNWPRRQRNIQYYDNTR